VNTKKAVTLTIIVAAPIGFWFGHSIGYGSGYSEGYSKGEFFGIDIGKERAATEEKERPVKHAYTFKKDGATIYRFDSATGETCWVQLSERDKGSDLPNCARWDDFHPD
jgi:hypothetical protein